MPARPRRRQSTAAEPAPPQAGQPPSAEVPAGQAAAPGPAPAPVRAHLVSHTPGRVRVRVESSQRHPRAMHVVRDRLDDALGPGRAQVNPTTGSVLVQYDRHSQSWSDVQHVLRDLGVVVEETARGLGLEVPDSGVGRSTTGERIVDAVSDLDRQLSALTGRKVDLKLLFPAALGGIGLWRLSAAGLGLAEVPAYVLLWYAFDSFWKFHREPGPTPASSPDGRPDSERSGERAQANP